MINISHRLETLREDVLRSYGHKHSVGAINAKFDELCAHHMNHARIKRFIPVIVEREMAEHFGAHRIHVRFASGSNPDLAAAAVALTKKHAGDALVVDAAVAHPENAATSHLSSVLKERGVGAGRERYLEERRLVDMPDYIVYLGRDIKRDEAGRDIKIWDLPAAGSMEETRELADDLEARVLYMLNRLEIAPVTAGQKATVKA
ncbi:protein tyrosine phosphatase [Corynebacterium phocae]|nr:protein tyrosine phosphatase [Corynebacterium phocae]